MLANLGIAQRDPICGSVMDGMTRSSSYRLAEYVVVPVPSTVQRCSSILRACIIMSDSLWIRIRITLIPGKFPHMSSDGTCPTLFWNLAIEFLRVSRWTSSALLRWSWTGTLSTLSVPQGRGRPAFHVSFPIMLNQRLTSLPIRSLPKPHHLARQSKYNRYESPWFTWFSTFNKSCCIYCM